MLHPFSRGEFFMITETILKKVYKPRGDWSRKYDFGSLLIIGGSKLYHGSPALAAMAALRTGVDLVTVAAPERAANLVASVSPDLITYPLKGDRITKLHLRVLLEMTKNKTAIVIGGGMGREKDTMNAIADFLKKSQLPAVIDADAIHAVASNKKVIKKNFIITPHFHEFYVLTGIEAAEDLEETVKKEAKKLGATLLLKGHIDTISDGERVESNKTGNPFMTKGGTGDTLAGICGSLLAQGIEPFDAACAAAYINGKAGDLAAKEKKQALLATDLIAKLPDALD
jgi:NAD(P)H-hydrate epimerase